MNAKFMGYEFEGCAFKFSVGWRVMLINGLQDGHLAFCICPLPLKCLQAKGVYSHRTLCCYVAAKYNHTAQAERCQCLSVCCCSLRAVQKGNESKNLHTVGSCQTPQTVLILHVSVRLTDPAGDVSYKRNA